MTKGILLIGYGTRAGNLTAVMNTQAARLRARGRRHLHTAYYRVSEPSIPEALSAMAAEGVDEVLAVPYYIAEGRITREFIPERLGITGNAGVADVDGDPVSITIAPAFGRTRALASIVFDRIAGAGGTIDDGILLIGHGTRDPTSENTRVVAMNADRVRRAGYKHVAYAFNEFNEPTIRCAMRSLVDDGAERIIVVPLFIADGVHLGEEVPENLGIPAYSEGGTVDVGVYEHENAHHHHHHEGSDAHGYDGSTARDIDITGRVIGWGPETEDLLAEAVAKVAQWAADEYGCLDGSVSAAVSNNGEELVITVDDPARGIVRTGSLAPCDSADLVVRCRIKGAGHEIAHRMYHAMSGDRFEIDQDHADLHHHDDLVPTGRTVDVVYTKPVGADPRLLEIIDSEISEFLGE